MFDITIYYKDGKRSFYDHVVRLTYNYDSDDIVLDFRTDFDDHIQKTISMNIIESIKVKKYES